MYRIRNFKEIKTSREHFTAVASPRGRSACGKLNRHEIKLVRECLSKHTDFLSSDISNSSKRASAAYETIFETNDSTNFIFVHSTSSSSRPACPGLLIFGCRENVTVTGKLNYSRTKRRWSSCIIPYHFNYMCRGVSQWTLMLYSFELINIQSFGGNKSCWNRRRRRVLMTNFIFFLCRFQVPRQKMETLISFHRRPLFLPFFNGRVCCENSHKNKNKNG